MLPPESQLSYLHYPFSTSPQKAAETQVTYVVMADGDCTLSLQRDLKKNEFHKQPDFKSSIISLHLYKIFVTRCHPLLAFLCGKAKL